MSNAPGGCSTPSAGPLTHKPTEPMSTIEQNTKEITMERARVGKPAPDFELTSFIGEGFKNVRLSDYKGKWIVVCFYPGDFTFV